MPSAPSNPLKPLVRRATTKDATALAAIYNHYVAHTIVTFEEEPVRPGDMAGRIKEILKAGLPWLVGQAEDGPVLGYAYASRWKSRCAYRHSVEATIYLHPDAAGRGLGTQLYTALIGELRQLPIHGIIGGVALPNPASVALHEKLGFRKVAQFQEVGWKFGKWIDVGYWELILPLQPR
jgi:L-amino acid N-acyltransferase YncA